MANYQPPDNVNWETLLRHSSALGILKPGVVFNVFNTNSNAVASLPNMVGQLPQPRLVRTGHSEDGTSVFAADDTVVPFTPFGPTASAFSVLDVRSAVPVGNTDPIPNLANALPRCPPEGVVFAIADHPGNGYSVPMHRTASLDYAVVLSGEIVLELDSGDERTVRTGEFIVQQGTNHKWTNRAAEPCRLLLVMVGAHKVMLQDGRVLEETAFMR